MVSTLLGSTRRIEKNQFASQLLTRNCIKVHQLALELRVVQVCKSYKKSTKICNFAKDYKKSITSIRAWCGIISAKVALGVQMFIYSNKKLVPM